MWLAAGRSAGAYILYITRGSVDVLLKTSKPSSKATHTTAAEGTPEGVSRPSSVADMRQGLPPSVPAADRRSLEKQASRGSLLPPDNASTSSAGAHSFAGAASAASGAPSAPLHRGPQQRRSSSQTYSQEGHNSTSNMSTGTSVADPEAQQAEYDQKLTRACARAQEFVRELQAAAGEARLRLGVAAWYWYGVDDACLHRQGVAWLVWYGGSIGAHM